MLQNNNDKRKNIQLVSAGSKVFQRLWIFCSSIVWSSFAFLLEDVPNSTHLEACHTCDSRKRCSKILCKKKGNKGKFLRFLVGFSFGLLFNFNKLLATLRGLKNFSCTVELNQAAHTDIYLAWKAYVVWLTR